MNPNQADAQPETPVSVPSQPKAVRYIAVDENGNPLAEQPVFQPTPLEAQSAQPQVVYMSRPLDPQEPEMSAETRARHESAKKDYPFLNLSEGEYIISSVRRHPIGLISIWAFVLFVVIALFAGLAAYNTYAQSVASSASITTGSVPSTAVLSIAVFILVIVFILGGYIATIVYRGNRFFLTNESVIQEVQTSLFTKREQTVSLSNIEDASYTQNGIIQTLVGYGSIRLSTEGDETTYRFNFVSNPKQQIALLNNAVEAFKNGRRVGK